MKLELVTKSVQEISTDIIVVSNFSNADNLNKKLVEADQMLEGAITELINQGDFLGKFKEATLIHTLGKLPAKYLLLIGLGEKEKLTTDRLRELSALIVRTANKYKAKTVTSCLFGQNHPNIGSQKAVQPFVEGIYLGNYHFNGYSSEREEQNEIDLFQINVGELSEQLKAEMEKGIAYAEGTNLTRDLVNTPGNMMTPALMAEQAIEIAKRYNMEYEILEKEEMEQLGMGGLLAVAQGSEQPPKMIVLKYQGKDKWDDEVIGLVGKGLTFDSGGISLKPSEGMEDMKNDMAGGAAVLGAMEAIGRLKPEMNILAVVPSTENMPSGKALKPGDVIKTMSGKTIEVLNTDAEGRLILADGITYAKKLGATRIIDLATLTGAVVIALGNITTAAMTNDQAFLDDFMQAAKNAGEKVWQLPTDEEYKEQIKSQIADLKNTGGKTAGSITAALFVGAFAENTPWIHLDIAGTAWSEKESNLVAKGGTGVMVRTLVQLVNDYALKH